MKRETKAYVGAIHSKSYCAWKIVFVWFQKKFLVTDLPNMLDK